MLHKSGSLNTPLWIVTRIEDEAVEHHRSIGCFTPAEDREPLTVDIVQRDDLSPDGDPARVQRNPAQVRVVGTRLSPEEAQELARLLTTAATVIKTTATPARPQRNWGGGWNGGYGLAPVRPESPMHPQRRSA